jgi:hypothetical protein
MLKILTGTTRTLIKVAVNKAMTDNEAKAFNYAKTPINRRPASR